MSYLRLSRLKERCRRQRKVATRVEWAERAVSSGHRLSAEMEGHVFRQECGGLRRTKLAVSSMLPGGTDADGSPY